MTYERANRLKQRVLKHHQFALVLVALIAFPHIGAPGQQKPGDDHADTRTQFIVGPRATLMPVGVFMLVKRDKSVGAVRFTNVEHGSDFGTGKAAYESYFQADNSKSLADKSVVRKSGIIDLRPLTGIGRFAFQTGNDRVDIGPWSFGSSFPGSLDMWPYRGDSQDYGYEFAPTSAQSVAEINISDGRLRWFRFDPDASVILQASELPK